MKPKRVLVIGAGMGGLAAAADLARRGFDVTVIEKAERPGGKMREVRAGAAAIDGGPTVFTMRWVFEGLFGDAGERLSDHLQLETAKTLARHAWRDGGRLDLFADIDASADAIAAFAGPDDAAGYRAFCARAEDVHDTLLQTFMAAQRPGATDLVRRVGLSRLDAMLRTAPMRTLWAALGDHFRDARMQQLFGRYSTYCGSSPFAAPATLMLVAHVEQAGVWRVSGGMARVADALQRLAERQGATFRFGEAAARLERVNGRIAGATLETGEQLPAEIVVFNGDPSALGAGLLGESVRGAARTVASRNRSLSAVTTCAAARVSGFDLHHHTVFFGEPYRAEFDAIFRQRTIGPDPTVYICAQDRDDACAAPAGGVERLLLLINAPADGDEGAPGARTVEAARDRATSLLNACGLHLEIEAERVTTPVGFNALFPGSGGALYGRANHGPFATFARPGAATPIAGLYLAGGATHPGPGIPMAALSGRLAARRIVLDAAGGTYGWREASVTTPD